MTVEWNLQVYNPSNYDREGFVAIPLGDILSGVQTEPHRPIELTLYDRRNNPIPFQIDPLDGPMCSRQDLSRAVLVFCLSHKLSPGPEDYSKSSDTVLLKLASTRGLEMLWSNASEMKTPIDDKLRIETSRTSGFPARVELANSQLLVSFNLRPSSSPDAPARTWWYSGSATSVRLRGHEMLAPWDLHWMGHDPEKRCMQIDRIRVERHPSQTSTPQEFSLFDRPYELISASSGPVRASVTLASEPFDYSYDDSTKQRCRLGCRLVRTISLYANADYITEELSVRAFDGSDTPCDVHFTARYFACMDIGFDPYVYQFPNVPDWFAVGRPDGYPEERHPGYGFACDAHVHVPLANPHPHYPDREKAHRTFSWQLHPCRKATCLHLFMHGTPGGFDSRIGHKWYEIIYKPLRARLHRKDCECVSMT